MEKEGSNHDWNSLPWADIPGFGSCFQVVSGKEVQNLFPHTASRKRSRSENQKTKSSRHETKIAKARSEREILAARWATHFDEDEVERHSVSSTQEDEPVQPWKNKNVEQEHNPPLRLSLLSSLQNNGYSEPTLIQERMLRPAILQRKDAIVAAPTGSGKTLAYVVPILHMLPEVRAQQQFGPAALIICPTRELAAQVPQWFFVRNNLFTQFHACDVCYLYLAPLKRRRFFKLFGRLVTAAM